MELVHITKIHILVIFKDHIEECEVLYLFEIEGKIRLVKSIFKHKYFVLLSSFLFFFNLQNFTNYTFLLIFIILKN